MTGKIISGSVGGGTGEGTKTVVTGRLSFVILAGGAGRGGADEQPTRPIRKDRKRVREAGTPGRRFTAMDRVTLAGTDEASSRNEFG
jgi:hypothetical protein